MATGGIIGKIRNVKIAFAAHCVEAVAAPLGNAVFNLLLGQFSSRLGLILVQICIAVFSLLVWRGTGLGWYAAGYFILGGYRTARSFILSTVGALIRPSQMGLAYGVAVTFDSLAMVLAPLLAGIIYSKNPGWVYPATLVLLVFVFLIMLFLFPRPSLPEKVDLRQSKL